MLEIAADAARNFRQSIETLPQRPIKTYADMKTIFGGPLPENPEDGEAVIQELARKAVDGLQMAAGPRFFGWVIGGSHIVGVAADWLTTAWGQNAGNHHAAPVRGRGGDGRRGVAARTARSAAREFRSDLSPAPRSRISSASPRRAARCCARPAGMSRRRACSARRRSPC